MYHDQGVKYYPVRRSFNGLCFSQSCLESLAFLSLYFSYACIFSLGGHCHFGHHVPKWRQKMNELNSSLPKQRIVRLPYLIVILHFLSVRMAHLIRFGLSNTFLRVKFAPTIRWYMKKKHRRSGRLDDCLDSGLKTRGWYDIWPPRPLLLFIEKRRLHLLIYTTLSADFVWSMNPSWLPVYTPFLMTILFMTYAVLWRYENERGQMSTLPTIITRRVGRCWSFSR